MSSSKVGLRHPSSRVAPAAIVAGLMVLLGAGVVTAVLGRLLSGRPANTTAAVARRLAGMHWNDPWVLTCAGLLAVAGLVLIIAALAPGRSNASTLVVQASAGANGVRVEQLEVALSRRSLERLVAARVRSVDGVDHVQVHAGPRRLLVGVTTATRYTDEVRRQVGDVVDRTLRTGSGLQVPPKPRVVVRQQS